MFATRLHPRTRRPARTCKYRAHKSARSLFFHPSIEAFEDRLLLSTFLVTNTDDSGKGSLRQAIRDANATPEKNTIAFAIGKGGVQTIRPLSQLPVITRPVVIDGSSQPGFMGKPLIELNGSSAGPNSIGLDIEGGSTMVKDLAIDAFGRYG